MRVSLALKRWLPAVLLLSVLPRSCLCGWSVSVPESADPEQPAVAGTSGAQYQSSTIHAACGVGANGALLSTPFEVSVSSGSYTELAVGAAAGRRRVSALSDVGGEGADGDGVEVVSQTRWLPAGRRPRRLVPAASAGTAARAYHAFAVDAKDMVVAFGLGSNGTLLNDIWSYGFEENSWYEDTTDRDNPPAPRAFTSGVIFRTSLFVYGGMVRNDGTGEMAPSNEFLGVEFGGDWTTYDTGFKGPGRWGHSTVFRNNKAIIFGGYTTASGGEYLSSVLLWDLNNLGSSTAVTLLEIEGEALPRAYHAAAIYTSRMYVFGGFDGTEYHNSLWSVDVSSGTGSWTLEFGNTDSGPRVINSALGIHANGLKVVAAAYGGQVGVSGTVFDATDTQTVTTQLEASAARFTGTLSQRQLIIVIITLVAGIVLIGFVIAFCVYRFMTRRRRWAKELDEAESEGTLAVEAEKEDTPDIKREMARERLADLKERGRADPAARQSYRRQMEMKAIHDAVAEGREVTRADGTVIAPARPELQARHAGGATATDTASSMADEESHDERRRAPPARGRRPPQNPRASNRV